MSENLKKNRCFEFASVKRNVGNMTNIWELKMEPDCSSSARSKPVLYLRSLADPCHWCISDRSPRLNGCSPLSRDGLCLHPLPYIFSLP